MPAPLRVRLIARTVAITSPSWSVASIGMSFESFGAMSGHIRHWRSLRLSEVMGQSGEALLQRGCPVRIADSAVVAADRNDRQGDVLTKGEKRAASRETGLLFKTSSSLPESCHTLTRLKFAAVDDASVPSPSERRAGSAELFGDCVDARPVA